MAVAGGLLVRVVSNVLRWQGNGGSPHRGVGDSLRREIGGGFDKEMGLKKERGPENWRVGTSKLLQFGDRVEGEHKPRNPLIIAISKIEGEKKKAGPTNRRSKRETRRG